MADEIDRGQASGEVARKHDNQHTMDVRRADNHVATYEDMGLSRQRVAEWRETRDAGPEVVEAAIQAALAEGRPPTKADIQKHVRAPSAPAKTSGTRPPTFLTRRASPDPSHYFLLLKFPKNT
jgi:hypothetical protein